jgi:hypothetical protein
METAPLKSFATWARAALIREVAARIAVVLAPASPERVEHPSAIAALEKAVGAAGGGEGGRAAVADKVAYTWFNRIIALRFMDANGYTGIGVVSPERDRAGGQPEVLAEAKRGNIDSTVITNKRTVETLMSLLNGTRPSRDPQGEAYALLLAEYCHYWNRSMPFMFEREGDYTELLIPANLLADDSVLTAAVAVLTEKVCQDVEVIGWLYQFYISERKDEVFTEFKKGKRAGAAEIPAATQLFTPHWIVRYLVENSLGRMWLLNQPTSRLAEQMEYYVAPVAEEADFLKVSSPEELRIIDPACGSGHMLTYAFDLLYAIYEEEGYAPSDIPSLIVAKNLYGTEIDPRAGALAAFALTMKARAYQRTFFTKRVRPNICVIEPISFTPRELDTLITRGGDRADEEAFWSQFQNADIFGSLIRPRVELVEPLRAHLKFMESDKADLISTELHERARRVIAQAEYLSQKYNVLVANPPYMGNKNMTSTLSEWLNANYPLSKADLMTAFMERATSMCLLNGWWGMIDLPSWMSLTTFSKFRRRLLASGSINSLVHLGRGVFGSDFGSVAFVISNRAPIPGQIGVYRRLFEQHVQVRSNAEIRRLFLDASYKRFEVPQSTFVKLPGYALAYWLPAPMRALFTSGKPLSAIAEVKHGLATGKNEAVLRYWWEVAREDFFTEADSVDTARDSGRKWFPYNKGGQARRWFGNVEHVARYDRLGQDMMSSFPGHRHDGRSHYFHPGITWSKVTAGRSAFRFMPHGQIFDVAGNSFFPLADDDTRMLLGITNSSTIRSLLEAISPTVNFEAGQIGSIPVLPVPFSVSESSGELIAIAKADWNSLETSWDFLIPRTLAGRTQAHMQLREVHAQILVSDAQTVEKALHLEEQLNEQVAISYETKEFVSSHVSHSDITLSRNPLNQYGTGRSAGDYMNLQRSTDMRDLVSYSVGCMFGRYSLDEPGLILADLGSTLQDYLAMIPTPSFMPDRDNVIPIIDGDWFEDDIVTRFRQFLRVAFGEQHFEDNLRFVTEGLGVKDLRDYFVKSFYKDHVQRYKKRPIYWLFSSSKASFNALIYVHRYTPPTVSTVLNEYLREFKAKLEASRLHHERLATGAGTPRQQAAARREVDRLRTVVLELDDYEHDVLYPLATQQVQINLDDGVKTNYPKFGAALKKITGLEGSNE